MSGVPLIAILEAESRLRIARDRFEKKPGGGTAWLSGETSDLGGVSEGLGAFTKFRISFHAAFCSIEAKNLIFFRDTKAHGDFQDHPDNGA